tara:strand:+ start:17902 stop:20460 length:2559 start_codon:yes stop_codon:yes gene_type:complete
MNEENKKRIIITGGLGYIGMELAKLYSGQTRKTNVTVIDNQYFISRVSQLKRWGIEFKQVDILDSENISKYLAKADIIYHLAGITDVSTTIHDIDKKKDQLVRNVGINGTKNIIKFSSANARIIFPSTHVIFEGLKSLKTDINENEEPHPVLEYSKGKLESEKDLINSKKDWIILRLGSVYGQNDDSTRLNIMPNLFSKNLSENGTIKLYSGGTQLKSIVSVKDVARCFKFVGENENLNKEIFNVVNENLTVKQIADICKKINRHINLELTKDPVPNAGYSLSNKKLTNEGFKFLYNFENSAKEFYKTLKDRKLKDINEVLEIGADDFVDDRGLISNYYIEDSINMIGYVESKKGSVRGNHYHPVQTQKCLLIKGQYISVTKDLLDKNSVIETRLIDEGELSTIPPNVAHTMVFLKDSIFLNLVNGEREHKNYGTTHTLKYELVDEKFANLLLHSYKTECRACGGGLNHYLSLGLSPLANNLNNNKKEKNDLYPLDLNFCNKCANSQLSVVVPPEKMFNDYLYLSSTSEKFKKHFVDAAKEFKSKLNLNNKSLVVDIGSNDGVFLDPIKKLGISVIGVEPAKNVSKIANSKGLKTMSEFFDEKTVNKIVKNYGKADLVTGFNVFAHSDGLKEILQNTTKLLKKDGQFIFEVQYLLRTLKDLTFDNIYHEHVNYWCLISLLKFFEDSKLKIYKVEEVDTHGGSLRVYASKNLDKKLDKSINKYLEIEKRNKLDKIETYFKFADSVKKIKSDSLSRINKIISEKKNIVGYGAPAKATTILNYFGINDNYFKYVIEDSEMKQDKFIPETNIKIIDKDKIDTKTVDTVIVLAWNFFDDIKRINQKYFPNAEFIKLK